MLEECGETGVDEASAGLRSLSARQVDAARVVVRDLGSAQRPDAGKLRRNLESVPGQIAGRRRHGGKRQAAGLRMQPQDRPHRARRRQRPGTGQSRKAFRIEEGTDVAPSIARAASPDRAQRMWARPAGEALGGSATIIANAAPDAASAAVPPARSSSMPTRAACGEPQASAPASPGADAASGQSGARAPERTAKASAARSAEVFFAA